EERGVLAGEFVSRVPRGPDRERIGDELAPIEFPATLRSMWSLGAMLHLAAGKTRYLRQRVYGALPAERRTPQEIDRAIADLTRQLVSDFARFPPSERPPDYPKWLGATQLPVH